MQAVVATYSTSLVESYSDSRVNAQKKPLPCGGEQGLKVGQRVSVRIDSLIYLINNSSSQFNNRSQVVHCNLIGEMWMG